MCPGDGCPCFCCRGPPCTAQHSPRCSCHQHQPPHRNQRVAGQHQRRACHVPCGTACEQPALCSGQRALDQHCFDSRTRPACDQTASGHERCYLASAQHTHPPRLAAAAIGRVVAVQTTMQRVASLATRLACAQCECGAEQHPRLHATTPTGQQPHRHCGAAAVRLQSLQSLQSLTCQIRQIRTQHRQIGQT